MVVNIESPGGMVHTYELAAAQLERIKKAEIPLTVCVDKVAASGGYLIACTANKILAAPFAIVGSIGVIAQVPNFNKLLKKKNIDYEEITSGEYKRTVSLFGEITEKGKQKFTEDIVETHKLFRDFVNKHRPHLDINQVATGEHWYGQQAIDKKLIDEIATSDEYLYSKINDFRIISVKVKEKQGLQKKLSEAMSLVVKKGISGYLKEVETDYKF